MRVTIIPSDGAVYENGLCYMPLVWDGTPTNVHALQYFDDNTGWIEFNDGTPNEDITSIPLWGENAMAAWTVANTPVPPTPPTAEENKVTAINLLQQTDWTQIPSVSDPALSNPYLANKLAFDQYRNAVRQYAIYPVEGNIEWATVPQEDWQSV
jgi:hypothetical protein